MNFVRLLLLLICLVAGGACTLHLSADDNVNETFADMLTEITASDATVRQAAEQKWQQRCWQLGAPDHDQARAEVCSLMCSGLKTHPAARRWLLIQLERIGKSESVEPIANLLDDDSEEVCDAAMRALARNPSAMASRKLEERLRSSKDSDTSIGLIQALRFRADPDSVSILATVINDSNANVAAAAVGALGKIGTSAAAEALASADGKLSAATRLPMSLARLRCADVMLDTGESESALSLFEELSAANHPKGVRRGAWQGQIRAAGARKPQKILQLLASDDISAKQIAVRYVGLLDTDSIKQLADGLPKLSAADQALLLQALGVRRDPAARLSVLKAARSNKKIVSAAGLEALGGVGDATDVSLLVKKALAPADPEAGNAAKKSLATSFAPGVDEALAEALKQSQIQTHRDFLLQVLNQRRSPLAVSFLLQQLSSDDAERRQSATKGLSRLAAENDVERMVDAMWTMGGKERDELDKAIVQVCSRIPVIDNRADPVIRVYRNSNDARMNQLLPLLGRLGGVKALAEIRVALSSNNADRFTAGLNGLSNWPDSLVSEDLLQLARNTQNESHRIRALRSLARVAVLGSSRSDIEKLGLLKQAMQLATRDEERSLILDRAGSLQHVDVVIFALPYLKDDNLVNVAAKTILKVAHRREIREPNQKEFDGYLAKVIAATNDDGLVQRARSYLSQE